MKDTGCQLQKIILYHPNAAWLASILASIDASHQVKIEPLRDNAAPYMVVMIDTSTGVKELRSVMA